MRVSLRKTFTDSKKRQYSQKVVPLLLFNGTISFESKSQGWGVGGEGGGGWEEEDDDEGS